MDVKSAELGPGVHYIASPDLAACRRGMRFKVKVTNRTLTVEEERHDPSARQRWRDVWARQVQAATAALRAESEEHADIVVRASVRACTADQSCLSTALALPQHCPSTAPALP